MNFIILHFLVGVLAYLAMFLLDYFNIYKFKSKIFMVLVLGFAKEFYDLFFEVHTSSILDVVYTFLGGLLIYLIVRLKRQVR